MPHPTTLLAATCLSATLATAQPMASITVTANGGGSATVQPGEPVTISAQLWQGAFSIAGMAGGTVVTNNAGRASNFSTMLPGLPTINFGSFQGGSRVDADIAFTPPGFLGGTTPPMGQTTFAIWSYTLTLDEPGRYDVNWIAPASAPDIRLYMGIASFSFTPVPSLYIGATITVLPAPATAVLLVASPFVCGRRRRF